FDDGTHGDLVAGDHVFSLSQPISATQAPGSYGLAFRIDDAQGRSTTGSINLNVIPFAWNEQTDGGGDAGELPRTGNHQVPRGTGPLAGISGNLGPNDTDMYEIQICDVLGFQATTVGGTDGDTQLFLFTSDGRGVAFDDDSAATSQSTVTGQFALEPGT